MPNTSHRRKFLFDLGLCIAGVTLALGVLYLLGSDEFSLVDYFGSVAELFIAPFFPGMYLKYPVAGGVALLVIIGLCYRLQVRSARLPLLMGTVLFWAGLGLLTIVRYYE